MREGSVIVSVGRYGGFYVHRGHTLRICLGWIALTVVPFDIDRVFQEGLAAIKAQEGVKR